MKGNLSVSRYSRGDVGTLSAERLSEESSKGDLSPYFQERAFVCVIVVYVLRNCLCHLGEADPAQLRQYLWFLKGGGGGLGKKPPRP